MPMTPFIGVRISWLIVARNSDLRRVSSCSSWLRCERSASSSDLSDSAAEAAARFFSSWMTTRRTRIPKAMSSRASSDAAAGSPAAGVTIVTRTRSATASAAPTANSTDV